jgi:hypothetical protein
MLIGHLWLSIESLSDNPLDYRLRDSQPFLALRGPGTFFTFFCIFGPVYVTIKYFLRTRLFVTSQCNGRCRLCVALKFIKRPVSLTHLCVWLDPSLCYSYIFVNPSIYCSKKLNYKLHFFVDSPFCIFLRQKKFLTFTTNYWVEKLLWFLKSASKMKFNHNLKSKFNFLTFLSFYQYHW